MPRSRLSARTQQLDAIEAEVHAQPALDPNRTVQLNVRLPYALRRRLTAQAFREELHASDLVRRLVQDYLDAEED